MVESAANVQEDGFELLDAKEQQKRDSIMNELYNEISSSDDDEDEGEAELAAASSAKAAQSEKEAAAAKQSTSGGEKGASEESVLNPFKRQVTQAQASVALKELYGEDYSEPIGFEEAESRESQVKLKDKLTAKLSSWFGRAKDKYADELENPDSKVSAVKRKIATLNEEINTAAIAKKAEEGASSLMVSIGIDEPLKETEFGMMNPYRTGLTQFLAAEDAKDGKDKRESEDPGNTSAETGSSGSGQERSQSEDQFAQSSTTETEGTESLMKENKDEFKFTIDADEDDEDELDSDKSDIQLNNEEVAQEEFQDSDEDEEAATPEEPQKDQELESTQQSEESPASEVNQPVEENQIEEETKAEEVVTPAIEEETKDGESGEKQEEPEEEEEEDDGEVLQVEPVESNSSYQEEEQKTDNPYASSKLPMEKKHLVQLKDFELTYSRKEVKRPGAFRSMVSNVREERLLTLRDGVLYSMKRVPSQNIAVKSWGKLFAQKAPETEQEALAQDDRGQIKGKSEISRLYKIDVVGRGQGIITRTNTELELILHFVNKQLDPAGKPDVKRYFLRNDEHSKKFLADLNKEAQDKSRYYD